MPSLLLRFCFWCLRRVIGSISWNGSSYSLPAEPTNLPPYRKTLLRSRVLKDRRALSRSSSCFIISEYSVDSVLISVGSVLIVSRPGSTLIFVSSAISLLSVTSSITLGFHLGVLETMPPIALAAAILVSHFFDLR